MSDASWGGVTQPSPGHPEAPPAQWLPRAQLQGLLDALLTRGYRVLAPVVRDAALHFDELKSVAELPVGWRDEQGPGRYRLAHTTRRTCSASCMDRAASSATSSRRVSRCSRSRWTAPARASAHKR